MSFAIPPDHVALDVTHKNGIATDAVAAAVLKRDVMKFHGLTMDSATGAAYWRSTRLALSVKERAVLGLFLRRAGQILTRERIASLVGLAVDDVDRTVMTLRQTLASVGATCFPCRADGVGYLLWHC